MTSSILFGASLSSSIRASNPTRISLPSVPPLSPTHRSSSSRNDLVPPTPIFTHRRQLDKPTDSFIVHRDRLLDTERSGFYLDGSRQLASIETSRSSGEPVSTPAYQFWREQVAPNRDVDALTLTSGADRVQFPVGNSGLKASHIRELRTHLPLPSIEQPPFGKVPVYRSGEANIPEDQHHLIWDGDREHQAQFIRAKKEYSVFGKLQIYSPEEEHIPKNEHHILWDGNSGHQPQFIRAVVNQPGLGDLPVYSSKEESPPENVHHILWDGSRARPRFVRAVVDQPGVGKVPVYSSKEKRPPQDVHHLIWDQESPQESKFIRGTYTSKKMGRAFDIYYPGENVPKNVSHWVDNNRFDKTLDFVRGKASEDGLPIYTSKEERDRRVPRGGKYRVLGD